MSIIGFPQSNKIHKKPSHHGKNPGELDVFEASRYFSGSTTNEVYGHSGSTIKHHIMREGKNSIPSKTHVMENPKKEKKQKQPNSPSGRLVSFMNSLFSQTPSKKKKGKSSNMKDEEENPNGRRKRRSSISHFRSISTVDSKSISSSNSGFRTPPTNHSHTPTKSYKDFSKSSGLVKSTALPNNSYDHEGFSGKNRNIGGGFSEKDGIWGEKYQSDEKGLRKFNDLDDGGDSDSSSDLFELQNYDLGYYSSGLPVYETTHMDTTIKRGAPISTSTL